MSSTRKQSEASTKGVKLPSNLQKIKSGYRFRKSIPADVRHIIKQTEFIRALGKDYRQAVLECAKLEAEVAQMIEAARKKLEVGSTSEQFLKNGKHKVLPGDSPNLSGHAAALFLSGLDADLNKRRTGQLDEAEFADLSQTFDSMLQKANFAIASGNVSAYPQVIHQLLYLQGYDVQATAEQWQTIAYDFVLAAKPGIEALVQRQAGNLLQPDISEFSEKDPGPAWLLDISTRRKPVATAESSPATLSSVVPHYEKHLANYGRKTQTTRLSWWQGLTDFCKDAALSEVTSNDIYNFFESRLDASEKGWSMKYCNQVRREFKVVFFLAKTKNLCTNNPAADVLAMPKIPDIDENNRKKPRFPFTIGQLNNLYASEWYNPDSESFKGKMKWDLSARYWIPLICLYHGLRVREATQIRVSDIVPGEHPLLRIQTEEGSKKDGDSESALPVRRVKNEASKRDVPIHPVLLELGFMGMVSEAKSRGATSPCFPSALPDRDSKHPIWGRAYEQSFLRYVRDKLNFGNGYGNHSFRHTLEDCLRNIQLDDVWPAGLGQFYSGRALPGDRDMDLFRVVGSERHYGTGYIATRVVQYVARIQYDGLKLPKPYKEWLDGKPSVAGNLIVILNRDWGSEWK
ncbi:hypothetical protein PQR63_15315 [Herbaspirillum rhizosphaerae]|uniref:DUF6538 domain-containing protein n=1 Tax=Herbaspirillum rhizosphaerae TaxID=346179 RepID=A0ABW8ZBL5_9BURK